jgi:outer membrane protein with beta-barrel domain
MACRYSLLLVVISIATLAFAQSDSKVHVYAGYSFLSNDFHITRSIGEASYFSNGRANLNGWNVSGEVKVFHWVGLVADFNGSYGSVPIVGIAFSNLPSTIGTHLHTYLFGPRISTDLGRFRPFAEALAGAATQSLKSDFDSVQDTRLATAFGGGVDYYFTRRFGWRLEADYLRVKQFKDDQGSVHFRFNRTSVSPRA